MWGAAKQAHAKNSDQHPVAVIDFVLDGLHRLFKIILDQREVLAAADEPHLQVVDGKAHAPALPQ